MLRLVGIGALGNMLSPAAIRLSQSNNNACFLRIYDRKGKEQYKQERRKNWLAHGAQLVSSYKALISADDFDGIVICAGKNGDDDKIIAELIPLINEHFKSDQKPFILHHSTVSIEFVQEAVKACSRYQIAYANYPLTGGAKGASSGTMLILTSGKKSLYSQVEPYLSAIGQPKYFDDDFTTAAKVKLIGHLMVFNGLMGIACAAALQAKSIQQPPLKAVEFFDFLNQGAGGTKQWDVTLKQAIADDNWHSGFLLVHAVIDAIYAADLLIENRLPRFAIYPLLQLACAFTFLVRTQEKGLATQAVLTMMLEPSSEQETFFQSIEHPKPSIFLENIINALPPALKSKVKLDISEDDFFRR